MFQFSKYQGLGNDFIILDNRHGQLPALVVDPHADWVRRLCDRHFGIGADGLILALPGSLDYELEMRIFNADGSEAEMCGNGIRCLARFLADSFGGDATGRRWVVKTLAGLVHPSMQADGQILVSMGSPSFESHRVPTTLSHGPSGLPQGNLVVHGTELSVVAVGMGNPHAVIPVQDLEEIDFEQWGHALECHPAFPARTNVHFLKVHAPDQLQIKVWERGAGPTLACGTGACATLVAAVMLGLAANKADVRLPGGTLSIQWPGRNGSVLMLGPAVAVFDGLLTPDLMPTVKDGLVVEVPTINTSLQDQEVCQSALGRETRPTRHHEP